MEWNGMEGEGRAGKSNGNGNGNGNNPKYPSPVENVPEVDESAEGITGFVLGVSFGLQYDQNRPGECYIAIEYELETVGQIVELLRLSYIPSTWAQTLEAVSDLNNLTAALFSYCQFEKVLNTINGIFTVQGASAAFTRILTALINTIPNLIQAYIDSPDIFTTGMVVG